MTQPAFTTPYSTAPYLTIKEFKDSPVSVNYKNLVVGGDAAAQDAALANTLARASSWADEYCDQILGATIDIEAKRVRMSNKGELFVHTNNKPVLEVQDVQFGYSPDNMTEVTSPIWISEEGFTVVGGQLRSSSQGPLQFGIPVPGAHLYVRYAYVNGFANTLLGADVAAGASSLTVLDATGIYGGPVVPVVTATIPPATKMTIYDGEFSEQISIASVAGGTLGLNAPLLNAHTKGATVSAMPSAIKQATVLLAVVLIKTRGDSAIVMKSLEPNAVQKQDKAVPQDVWTALGLITKFRRIR